MPVFRRQTAFCFSSLKSLLVLKVFPCVSPQHDPEDLRRETEILEGWERLCPPPDVPLGASKPLASQRQTMTPQTPGSEADRERPEDGVGGGELSEDKEAAGGGCGRGGGSAPVGRRRRKPATVDVMIQ